ncbi:MAG: hypothetical protein ACRYFX_07795 [Janthinobacterium lividum]
MKQRLTPSLAGLLLASTLAIGGCAGSYTPIRPQRLATYQAVSGPAPLQFAYQFDALRTRGGNKKYVKKELKRGYHVVAVRITNTTAAEVNFSRDAVLYFGDRPVIPVSNEIAAQDMKQGVFIYLLYLLLNFNVGGTTTTSYSGQTTTTGGTFIPTGPFIAGGNILGASLANKNFQQELTQYDLTNRNIHPGETVYGLVCLRETGLSPLRLELRTMAAGTPPSPVAPALPPAATPSRD